MLQTILMKAMRFSAIILALLFIATAEAAGRNRLLAVFSHPDDETVVGPLLAKYAAEGHEVYLVTVTAGQKGIGNSTLRGAELGAARRQELECSASNLGIRRTTLLEFEDQGISTASARKAIAKRLRAIVNDVKPDILITWGPDGFTGHIDHMMTSNIVTQAFQQRRLLSHPPKKLYYVAMPEIRSLPAGLRGTSHELITTEIDCRESLDAAAEAIRCHKTQWTEARMKELDAMHRMSLDGKIFLRLAMSEKPLEPGRKETSVFEGLP